jgi:hypothetical protein
MRNSLLIIGVACLAACCCVNRDYERDEHREIVHWTTGLFFSPFLEFSRTTEYADGQPTGFVHKNSFNFISVTFGLFVAGVVALEQRSKRGPKTAQLPTAGSESPS